MQISKLTGELADTRQELEEMRKEVAIEREARQQMLLWMRECFGKNLELLDARIQAQVTAAVGSSTSTAGARKTGVAKSSSATVVAQAAEMVPESMSEWLRMIGYDRYIPVFKKYNMGDLAKCSRLEDRHLVKMGIDLKRHRSDIVSEIKTLKSKLASKKEKEGGSSASSFSSSATAQAMGTPKRVHSIVVEAQTVESPSRSIEAAEATEAAEAEAARAAQEAKKKEEEAARAAEAAVEAAVRAAEAEAAAELVKEGEEPVIRGPTVDPFSDADVEKKINREEERRKQWEDEKRQWMEEERERMRKEFMEEEERKLKAEKERLRREADEEVQREVAKQQAQLQEEARRKERALEEEQRRLKESEVESSREAARAQERKKKRLSTEKEKRTTPKRSEVVEEQVVSVSALTRPRKTRRGRRTPHRSDRSGSESESASDYLTEGSDDEGAFSSSKRDVYGEPSMHDLALADGSHSSGNTGRKRTKSGTQKAGTAAAAVAKPAEDYYSDNALAASAPAKEKATPTAAAGADDNMSHAARVTEVKSDYSELDWVVFDFDKAAKKVNFGAWGGGGLEEMCEYIDDGKVQYGLLRLLEEGRRRVKFVFLVWLGPSSGVITKARSQTHKAAIMADIGQFHLELISENRDELSLDEIWKRLKKHVDF